jgi:hypothetical protein
VITAIATIPAGAASTPVNSLTFTQAATSVTITPSIGAGITIPAATNTLAGMLDATRAGFIDGVTSKNPNLQSTTLSTIPLSLFSILDGRGSAIGAGFTRFLQSPFHGTITSWTLLTDTSATISIDVWKCPLANYPPTSGNSIVGGSAPYITAGSYNSSSSLGSWSSTVINIGDCIAFHTIANNNATVAFISLQVTPS